MKYIKKYESLNFKFGKGTFLRDKEFVENIYQILKFLKEKEIEYKIYHGSDSIGEMFFIIYSNYNDYNKFPNDKWNENKPYLPVDEAGFEIREIFIDMLDDFKEIRLDLDNLEDFLDFLADIIQARKYNL